MRKARRSSDARQPVPPDTAVAVLPPNEAEVMRRRLAEAEAELAFYRSKQDWLQAALASQRQARQVLEAGVSAGYKDTITRIRDAVRSLIPEGATVVVISKGDQDLLNLEHRRAWHYPQNEDGGYAGYYPADSAEAIRHLQSLIAKGGEFLLVPSTAFWWFEYYREWDDWLARFHALVWRDERCAIYRLVREKPAQAATQPDAPATTQAVARASGLCPSRQPSGLAVNGAHGEGLAGQRGLGSFPPEQAAPQTEPPTKPGELLCFPVIDWEFRFQRPQQLMLQFARAGYRVFYLTHQFRKSGEPYVLRSLADSVWEVSLQGPRFNLHQGLLDPPHCERLAASLATLRCAHFRGPVAMLVQSPFWWPLVEQVARVNGWPVIYDCMDYHPGFATSNPVLVEHERELFTQADLVVASSAWLQQQACRYSRRVLLVRNGCDYEHFAQLKPRPTGPRPVIGYYGAIADWFDADLVADLAERRPDWDFLLVGSTFAADLRRLSKLPNVTFPGEKPYAEIPEWLARFDVAILPFKRTPLTEAANPVKIYEIFASGKPLVSVPLPELVPLAPLARLAATAEEFEREIEAELRPMKAEAQRRAFAKANTWRQRFEQLSTAVQQLWREPVRRHPPSLSPEPTPAPFV